MQTATTRAHDTEHEIITSKMKVIKWWNLFAERVVATISVRMDWMNWFHKKTALSRWCCSLSSCLHFCICSVSLQGHALKALPLLHDTQSTTSKVAFDLSIQSSKDALGCGPMRVLNPQVQTFDLKF